MAESIYLESRTSRLHVILTAHIHLRINQDETTTTTTTSYFYSATYKKRPIALYKYTENVNTKKIDTVDKEIEKDK